MSGQDDILEALRKSDKPLSRGQIAKILDWIPSKVSMRIHSLLTFKEIGFEELDRHAAAELIGDEYPIYRRTKFYFFIKD